MKYFELLLAGQLSWNLPLLAGLFCLIMLYAFLVKRVTNIKLNHVQPFLFFIGLVLLYLAIGTPLSTISHLSFSLHMLQMSILYFMVPPMLLLGLPYNIFKLMHKSPLVKGISKLFPPPRVVLIIFAVFFTSYHLPGVLNVVTQSTLIQNSYLLLLFLSSFGMWWPIASPDPKQRFRKARMKRYAFQSGLILMPACLLFILNAFLGGLNNPFLTQITAHLCTPSQASSLNLLPSPFNTKFDQLMAGTLMLGMHKFSIMFSFRFGNNTDDKEFEQL